MKIVASGCNRSLGGALDNVIRGQRVFVTDGALNEPITMQLNILILFLIVCHHKLVYILLQAHLNNRDSYVYCI